MLRWNANDSLAFDGWISHFCQPSGPCDSDLPHPSRWRHFIGRQWPDSRPVLKPVFSFQPLGGMCQPAGSFDAFLPWELCDLPFNKLDTRVNTIENPRADQKPSTLKPPTQLLAIRMTMALITKRKSPIETTVKGMVNKTSKGLMVALSKVKSKATQIAVEKWSKVTDDITASVTVMHNARMSIFSQNGLLSLRWLNNSM